MKYPHLRKIIAILIFILLGFLSSLFIENLSINSVVAQVPDQSNIQLAMEQNDALSLETKGQQFYYQGNYQDAIQWWQKAQETYQLIENSQQIDLIQGWLIELAKKSNRESRKSNFQKK